MKTCLSAIVFSFCAFTLFAAEPTPAAAPTPAETKSVLASPAPAAGECNGETCSTCRHSHRQGLFGRTIDRTREVTRTVVEVPVKVVTAPVRVFRARRGSCCCQ